MYQPCGHSGRSQLEEELIIKLRGLNDCNSSLERMINKTFIVSRTDSNVKCSVCGLQSCEMQRDCSECEQIRFESNGLTSRCLYHRNCTKCYRTCHTSERIYNINKTFIASLVRFSRCNGRSINE